MKVYLLNPPFAHRFTRTTRWQGCMTRNGVLYYPIWLAYATGVIGRKYSDVRLVDAPAWNWDREDVIRDAVDFKPDLIIVDSNFSSLTKDVQMASLLKENIKGSNIVLVGPPVSQFTDKILANGGIDVVARFEYDLTIREIADAIAEGKDLYGVKGISYKKDGEVIHNPDREFTTSKDLDEMPFVSKIYREHLNIRDYFLGHALYPEVQIFTGRGCPNLCTFCSWPETLMGRKHRARSVQNVVEEFEYVANELPGVKEIFIEDDTFTIGNKRIVEFCNEIIKRNLNLSWSCNARANLDYEIMRLMKEAGCRLLDVGFESGDEGILKNIKKGVSSERMNVFAEDARKAGLMVLGDFVFGFPGETKETAAKTIDFAKKIQANIVQFAVATPIPGTKFHKWVEENDYLLSTDIEESIDKEGFQKCIISYPEFTNNDIENYVDLALKKYYLSPSFVPIALRNVFRKNGWSEFRIMLRSVQPFFKYLRRAR